MTLQLTYQTQPQPHDASRIVGTPKSGTIAVPILGGITTDEDTAYALALADQPSTFETAAKLAEAFHAAHGISRTEGYAIIQSHLAGITQEPAALDIALQHPVELENIKRQWVREFNNRRLAAVLILVQQRLGQPHATLEDLGRQPVAIVNGIYDIWQSEQAVNTEPTPPMTDDVLKKPLAPDESSQPLDPGPPSSGSLPTGSPDSLIAPPMANSSPGSCAMPSAVCAISSGKKPPATKGQSPS